MEQIDGVWYAVCPLCDYTKELTTSNFLHKLVKGVACPDFYDECRVCRYWTGVHTQETEAQKYCTRCRINVPIDEFTLDPHHRDGLYPWCANCKREYRRKPKPTPEPKPEPVPVKLTWTERIQAEIANKEY